MQSNSNNIMIVFGHLTILNSIYLTFIFETANYRDVPNLGTLPTVENLTSSPYFFCYSTKISYTLKHMMGKLCLSFCCRLQEMIWHHCNRVTLLLMLCVRSFVLILAEHQTKRRCIYSVVRVCAFVSFSPPNPTDPIQHKYKLQSVCL